MWSPGLVGEPVKDQDYHGALHRIRGITRKEYGMKKYIVFRGFSLPVSDAAVLMYNTKDFLCVLGAKSCLMMTAFACSGCVCELMLCDINVKSVLSVCLFVFVCLCFGLGMPGAIWHYSFVSE